ncbi:TonB-dependent receptor [Sphingobium phenoxybenzoativorans]|uniref:TonB-dependent receptor n=1 Tax=Sphingobium phenoxybenzoativorans TaxID=1592790 RepID=UPI0008724327|nr:TonB-dependent receptor [Sphingobium phenoxybenzoativorans]
MLRKFLSTSAILTVSVFGAATAYAQEPAPAEQASADKGAKIEDIVVTAQRQAQSVQQTPLAITAVGGDTLKDRGIVDIDALTRSIPNFNFSRVGSDARVFIRGVGLVGNSAAGFDGRVAIYTDDVVNGRTQAALGSLFDLNRIEVLRGPQGTLYGRNATAGAVNIISNDPTNTLDGYASLTVGNYNLIRAEGAISGPLSDTVSARLAFQTNDRDGFGKNVMTGNPVDSERSRAVRAKLRFEPSETFHFTLTGEYRWEDDNAGGYAFVRPNPFRADVNVARGYVHPSNPRDRAGVDQQFFMENFGLTGNAVLKLSDSLELTSVTGYRYLDQASISSTDNSNSLGTAVDLATGSRQLSQELRLALKSDLIDLVVGGFYFHEKNDFVLDAAVSPLYFGGGQFPLYVGFRSGGAQKTNAYAAFAQGTLHVTDKLGIDIGARYSYEKRSIDQFNLIDFVNVFTRNPAPVVGCPAPAVGGFVPGRTLCYRTSTNSASWSSFDPKVAIHYQISDTVMAYASYSRGFKSGGFDFGQLRPAFDPEKLVDYEGGIKADLFDRRLRLNLAGFYYDYTNLQFNVVRFLPTPGNITINAAKARLYGAEAEITVLPVDDLRLAFNLAWLHNEYRELTDSHPVTNVVTNLAGNQLISAPKYKLVGEVGYTFHPSFADITPRAELSWTSKQQFSHFNLDYMSQPSFWELNLYLDVVRRGDWKVSAYGRNVTNKLYYVANSMASAVYGSFIVGQPAAPATYGLAVTKYF